MSALTLVIWGQHLLRKEHPFYSSGIWSTGCEKGPSPLSISCSSAVPPRPTLLMLSSLSRHWPVQWTQLHREVSWGSLRGKRKRRGEERKVHQVPQPLWFIARPHKQGIASSVRLSGKRQLNAMVLRAWSCWHSEQESQKEELLKGCSTWTLYTKEKHLREDSLSKWSKWPSLPAKVVWHLIHSFRSWDDSPYLI